MRDLDGVTYCKDGDCVESCTALVEGMQGRMILLRWTESVEVIDTTGFQTMACPT